MLVYLAHPVASDPAGNYQKAKPNSQGNCEPVPRSGAGFACVEFLLFSRARRKGKHYEVLFPAFN